MFTSHLTVRQSFLWRAVNRRITPHDAACIAVCTQGANLLRENGVKEEKIRVIFNGVAPKPLPPRRNVIRTEFTLPEDCFVFLTMARYAPEKGLFFLLDALAQLKERTDAPFACLIAGDGEHFLTPWARASVRRALTKTSSARLPHGRRSADVFLGCLREQRAV